MQMSVGLSPSGSSLSKAHNLHHWAQIKLSGVPQVFKLSWLTSLYSRSLK